MNEWLTGLTTVKQVESFVNLTRVALNERNLLDNEAAELEARARERLAELLEAREKRMPPTRTYFPIRKKSDLSRPQAAAGKRDEERWERKRRLGSKSALPGFSHDPRYEGFTEGERAVLYILAADQRERGSCRCTVAEIADRAGVGPTTARNAIRKAKQRLLIIVQHRPQWRGKWLANVISIVCRTWLGWLRGFRPNIGRRSVLKGVNKAVSTDTVGKRMIKGQPSYSHSGSPTGGLQPFAGRKLPSG